MPTKITMPQLGESVSEGTVGRWLKQEGDTVKRDESLVEIVTDKVTAELPSPAAGRLVKILVAEDQTVRVGTDIAEIEEAGSATSAPSSAPSTSASPTAGPETTAGATPAPMGSENGPRPPAHPIPAGNGTGVAANAGRSATATAERIERVSPLARRMAQEHQIDLREVQGSGENGRVRKEDILAFVQQRSQTPQPVAPSAPMTFDTRQPAAPAYVPSAPASAASAPAMSLGDEVVNPSPARRAIAEHMVRSKRTSPHAWTMVEVDVTNVARWLDAHKDEFKRREGYGISYQTAVIKAAVEALREHPYLNASWTEDNKVILRKQIHVGVSIALDNNLIVPVIRNADMLNLAGIARAVNDLVTRARANRLQPAEVQGATFTVNNPGVFGTVLSMAIINQPNAGILTMDAVVKRPVVVDDAIAIRSMMNMSLSFDHRIIDGLTAAQFLGAIKRRLESWGPDVEVY